MNTAEMKAYIEANGIEKLLEKFDYAKPMAPFPTDNTVLRCRLTDALEAFHNWKFERDSFLERLADFTASTEEKK